MGMYTHTALDSWRDYHRGLETDLTNLQNEEADMAARIAEHRLPVDWSLLKGMKRLFNEVAILPALDEQQKNILAKKTQNQKADVKASSALVDFLIDNKLETDPAKRDIYRAYSRHIETTKTRNSDCSQAISKIDAIIEKLEDTSTDAAITSVVQAVGAILTVVSVVAQIAQIFGAGSRSSDSFTDSSFSLVDAAASYRSSGTSQALNYMSTEQVKANISDAEGEIRDFRNFIKAHPGALDGAQLSRIPGGNINQTGASNDFGMLLGAAGGNVSALNLDNAGNLWDTSMNADKAVSQLKRLRAQLSATARQQKDNLNKDETLLNDFKYNFLKENQKQIGLSDQELATLQRPLESLDKQIERDITALLAQSKPAAAKTDSRWNNNATGLRGGTLSAT